MMLTQNQPSTSTATGGNAAELNASFGSFGQNRFGFASDPSTRQTANQPHFQPPSQRPQIPNESPSGSGTDGPANIGVPMQPNHLRPAYRYKQQVEIGGEEGPGRRLRKNLANIRRHVDYTATVLNHLENRLIERDWRDRAVVAPDLLYSRDILPAPSWKERPVDCVLTKFLRAAMNKIKCPVYDICWTPEGRRLITGASSGEFTLWNGTAFNFETILQAHDTAIRALKWSHDERWLVSADHDGFVKYWQANMNNVHMYQAHKEAVRCLSFSPSDIKLATASDDGTVRIWDFLRCTEERVLRGHGSDVRCVDWHPQKGLLASGSRDSQQPVKIWDPKSGQCLATLHDHKNSAMAVEWNKNGNWLITGSRDHLIKLYDIRMMREVRTFRGHKKEVTSLAWHPVHEGLFVSGGGDGSLAYWLTTSEKEAGLIEHAHDQAIWTLEWHPLGHILASGSNDNNTKFWTRNKPGDLLDDFYGMSTLGSGQQLSESGRPLLNKPPETAAEKLAKTQAMQEADRARKIEEEKGTIGGNDNSANMVIPGMGLEKEILDAMKKAPADSIPGLGATLFPDNPIKNMSSNTGAKKTLIKQPPPKMAQRALERVWNVSKPMGYTEGGDDGGGGGNMSGGGVVHDQSGGGPSDSPGGGGGSMGNEGGGGPLPRRAGKKSLLGPAPPPSSNNPNQNNNNNQGPPGPPQNSDRGGMMGGPPSGPPSGWNMNGPPQPPPGPPPDFMMGPGGPPRGNFPGGPRMGSFGPNSNNNGPPSGGNFGPNNNNNRGMPPRGMNNNQNNRMQGPPRPPMPPNQPSNNTNPNMIPINNNGPPSRGMMQGGNNKPPQMMPPQPPPIPPPQPPSQQLGPMWSNNNNNPGGGMMGGSDGGGGGGGQQLQQQQQDVDYRFANSQQSGGGGGGGNNQPPDIDLRGGSGGGGGRGRGGGNAWVDDSPLQSASSSGGGMAGGVHDEDLRTQLAAREPRQRRLLDDVVGESDVVPSLMSRDTRDPRGRRGDPSMPQTSPYDDGGGVNKRKWNNQQPFDSSNIDHNIPENDPRKRSRNQ